MNIFWSAFRPSKLSWRQTPASEAPPHARRHCWLDTHGGCNAASTFTATHSHDIRGCAQTYLQKTENAKGSQVDVGDSQSRRSNWPSAEFPYPTTEGIGVPDGIRTRVTAVKGRCPGPLDDGDARVTASLQASFKANTGMFGGSLPPQV